LISFSFGRHAIVTGTDCRNRCERSFGFGSSGNQSGIEITDRLSLFEVCLGETEAWKQFLADEEPTN